MILEEIINIINSFYPSGLNAMDDYDKYIESIENKKLNETKFEVFQSKTRVNQVNNIIRDVKKRERLNNIEDITSESFDRCFSLKIDFKEEGNLHQLYIRLSVLAPLYVIYVVSNPIENDPYRWIDIPRRNKEYENSISEEIKFLQGIIEKQTSYSLVNETLLTNVLDDLSYEDIDFGNFTIFNALFLNEEL